MRTRPICPPWPLVEQLWGRPTEAGLLRVRATLSGSTSADGWVTVERYRPVPSSSRASILLPVDPRAATVGSLLNYRSLRRRRTNAQRLLLGYAVRSRLPLPLAWVLVEVPAMKASSSRLHPVGELAHALGQADLRASIGVRVGANRKATLQLVDAAGQPIGFAKMSWNDSSADGVRRETAALTSRGTSTGGGEARSPAVLATGRYFGAPYLVTSPLPLDCRGVRAGVPPPTPRELASLGPVVRQGPIAETRQLQDVVTRLAGLKAKNSSAALIGAALRLATTVQALNPSVPVGERWHGDLTPWNTARDSRGALWCWDWESSEDDAVVGMDLLHWHLSVARESGRGTDASTLTTALDTSALGFLALGLPRRSWPVVVAVYVLTLVERTLTLASQEGGWEGDWLTAPQLAELLQTASGPLQSVL